MLKKLESKKYQKHVAVNVPSPNVWLILVIYINLIFWIIVNSAAGCIGRIKISKKYLISIWKSILNLLMSGGLTQKVVKKDLT